MAEKTVNSSSIWYHISSASGDSAARWTKGAARKGTQEGKKNLSVILFDQAAIGTAIGNDALVSAELILRRDTAYGEDAVTLSVAPAQISSILEEYVSRTQALEMAMRPLHRNYTIEGETVTLPIPGGMLREIKSGNVNAFVLYQEQDAGDGYCKMSTDAVLKMMVGNETIRHVWTRDIGAGDVISSDIYSHINDLRELEYYINLHRTLQTPALDPIDIGGTETVGSFAEWADVIGELQTGAAGYMSEAPAWTEPTEGEMPRADLIKELRGAMDGTASGVLTASAFSAMQTTSTGTGSFSKTRQMTWGDSGAPAKAGMYKRSMQAQGAPGAVTVYDMYSTGWIFAIGETPGANGAEFGLTVKKSASAKPRVALYGIKVSAQPESASYSVVFDDTKIGEADCAVGSQTIITLNAAGISKINDGSIHGIGIRYDNSYIEIDKEAELTLS